MRRRKVSVTSLSHTSLTKNGRISTVIFGLILIAVLFLAGCASQKGMVSDSDYLSLLPKDAEIYLRFPVQENPQVALALITSFAPQMTNEEGEKLVRRFDTIYGAVKEGRFSAIATGSFPKIGLGFALKEKNGWKKIKDSAIPVTGTYYQYQNLPFQIAFPSSSVMMLATQVDELLSSYEQQYTWEYPTEANPLALFISSNNSVSGEGSSMVNAGDAGIDFYVSNAVSVVLPILQTKLSISLPIKDLYGSFIHREEPTSGDTEGFKYLFVGYVGLSDARAMKASLTTLKLVARGLGINLDYSSTGEETIRISGITLSQKDLGDLLKKIF